MNSSFTCLVFSLLFLTSVLFFDSLILCSYHTRSVCFRFDPHRRSAHVETLRPWTILWTPARWPSLKAVWLFYAKLKTMLSTGWFLWRLQHSWNKPLLFAQCRRRTAKYRGMLRLLTGVYIRWDRAIIIIYYYLFFFIRRFTAVLDPPLVEKPKHAR